MPPMQGVFVSQDFLVELVYSIIVMVSSLVIYLKTKEIYNLSSHKGIKYFRMTFLFFTITYFLRFFSKILVLGLIISGTMFIPRELPSLTTLLLVYTGFMTTFYLFYGLSMKRDIKNLPDTDYLHILAIFLSSIVIILNSLLIFVGVSVVLLIYMLFVSYSDYAKARKKKPLFQFDIIYFLLILFLMLNIFDVLVPEFFMALQVMVYAISLSLVLIILYKVLKILSAESNGREKK